MEGVGEGIAFAGMAISCAALEIDGHDIAPFWVLLVIWVITSDWGQTRGK